MKFAIVGGGPAAFEAAVALREADAGSEITIYSREAVRPYRRPALSRMVAEELGDAQFYIKPEAFYNERNIGLQLDREVTGLDPAAKRLIFADGGNASFDRLLLATGAHCFLPPVPGMELAGVMTLREHADLLHIRERLDAGARKIAVIGGGLLGLELAESLLKRGCRVSVIEACPILLPRNLDAEAANIVLEMMRCQPDLHLHFGHGAVRIVAENGRAAGVELPEFTEPADLVIVSAGVRCNTALALQAGLRWERGIITDALLRTSAPDIFAAGDCAEVDGTVYGLYDAARQMGKVAAANMMGAAKAFEPEAFPARLVVFGIKIFSAGVLEGVRAEVAYDAGAGQLKKLFFDAEEHLVGAILVGDLKEAAALQKRIVTP